MGLTDQRKLLLLGILRQSDMHGYLLNAHLDGTIPISLKKPTAYNLLDRMEEDGWVRHRDEPTGDRPRKVFSLTDAGEQAFQKLLREQLQEFTPAESPSAVSVSFLDAIPVAEALELLRQRRKSVAAYRNALVPHKQGDAPDGHHAGSAHFAIEYARRLIEMERQILDDLITHLEAQ